MTAEQIRDSLLFVSGALDDRMGGPSTPLSPSFTRRTVYGKVSRYKLDDYLQLFDFPSPNLSAERRFTTTVPLQRLFFMNSDFMEQQGELIARRVAPAADNAARIQAAYRLIFGRAASDSEVKAGVAFLTERADQGATRNRKTQGTPRPRRTPRQRRAKDTKDAKKEATADDHGQTAPPRRSMTR